jgi:Sec1 family
MHPLALHGGNECTCPTLTSLTQLTVLMGRLRSAPTLNQPRCPPSRCSSWQLAAVLRPQSERQPIPDVPAVYFVRGGEAAVDAVAADAAKGLYDAMHLNFAPGLPPPLLERLAGKLVSAGAAHRVAKVPSALAVDIAHKSSAPALTRQLCEEVCV